MRTPLLLALLAVVPALSSAAPGFDARVRAAGAAIGTPAGLAYDMALVPAIHAAVLPCVPAGAAPSRGGAFALVADVDATGRLHGVEVSPASPIARCFARNFGATRLRAPPTHAPTGWPILVRMQTHR